MGRADPALRGGMGEDGPLGIPRLTPKLRKEFGGVPLWQRIVAAVLCGALGLALGFRNFDIHSPASIIGAIFGAMLGAAIGFVGVTTARRQ